MRFKVTVNPQSIVTYVQQLQQQHVYSQQQLRQFQQRDEKQSVRKFMEQLLRASAKHRRDLEKKVPFQWQTYSLEPKS